LSEEKKKNLWYEFDNWSQFKVHEDPPRARAVGAAMAYSYSKRPFGNLTYREIDEDLNGERGRDLINTVNTLVPGYLQIFNSYFGQKFEQETNVIESFPWDAFVDFGLGMLYDPRPPRPQEFGMHVMDPGMGGYFSWHRFHWLASKLTKPESPFRIGKWLYLDRLLGLAAELHSTSKPNQTKVDGSPPDNPPNGDNISMDQIRSISKKWLDLDFEGIEQNMSQLEDWEPRNPGKTLEERLALLSQDSRLITSRVHIGD
jgi:hypothetical protein